LNGILYNPESRTIGHFDIIIKHDILNILFPYLSNKFTCAKLNYDPDSYTFIQVKYCQLKLCTQNIYVLNTSINHKKYKMEQAHLYQVLQYYTFMTHISKYNFLIGYGSSYISHKIHHTQFNSIQSIGVVDLNGKDSHFNYHINYYHNFLIKLRQRGKNWTIDPPSKKKLYPNMKNTHDFPWSNFKEQLANKNNELTMIWNIGVNDREKIRLCDPSITSWEKVKVHHLTKNNFQKSTINNIITSNISNNIINLDTITIPRHDIEFYVDFEFINHLNDLSSFPMCHPNDCIYMIGCLCVNRINNRVTHTNYVIDRLSKQHETIMMNHWIQDMIQSNNDNSHIHIYHWGNAEKNQIEKHFNHDNIISYLKLYDLCHMFKMHQVGIPGAFNYSLKSIAKTLYNLKIIDTTWDNEMSGKNTISTIINAEKKCSEGLYDKLCNISNVQKIIDYNYVDCQTMYEISKYITKIIK
jgi:hypothetical protein